MSGKGDRLRPVDRDKFNRNFDRIFANKKDRKAVKHFEGAPDRCPNTIDIEEQIQSDRETE